MLTLVSIPARSVHHAHTLVASFAFGSAFALACLLHYKKVVKNGIASYPDEWFPSVSASIGDWAPERSIFQILIALCSGPRFALIALQWLTTRRKSSLQHLDSKKHDSEGINGGEAGRSVVAGEGGLQAADWLAVIGVVRTFCCGGWVYVTSSDNHDFHDFAMIAYVVLTLPWMLGTISSTPTKRVRTVTRRIYAATLFHALLVPLIYFFVQHKVHRIKGAYSYYAIFEWSLVLVDVYFDSLGVYALGRVRIQVVLDEGALMGKVMDGVDGSHRITNNGNTFQLGEGLFPALPVSPESLLMEYPLEKNGWQIREEEKEKQTPPWRMGLSFIVDVYLAFCTWTIFTELGLQLFYFSVWQLALSGSELALLATLSPILLSYPSISRFATSRHGASTLRVLGLVFGLGAYRLPGPGTRLVAVSLANAAAWLELGGGLKRLKGGKAASTEGSYLMLGLLLSMLAKLVNNSINPLWCIVDDKSGGWNKTGIVLAFIAWAEKAYRPVRAEPQAALKPESAATQGETRSAYQSWSIALGLGSLLFLVQTFLADTGTIIAWNWTGYPVNGPRLLWQAGIVMAAASAGLALRLWQDASRNGTVGFKAFTLTVASCYIVCFPDSVQSLPLMSNLGDWTGFGSGCVLIGALAYIFPVFWQHLSLQSTNGNLLAHALLFNVVLDVLSVVTVAYAFVPGGQYLREKTGPLTFLCAALVANAGTVLASLSETPQTTRERPETSRRLLHSSRLGAVLLLLLTLATEAYIRVRRGGIEIKPYHDGTGIWTGGIWTVHFGVDLGGRDSQRRMLDLIKEAQVDVIGLLESDLHRFVYGNRDLTRMISEELGYYVDLGPGPNKHTWGAALLSKFPILESSHHLLPSPHGELAPAIFAKLQIYDQVVNVIVSHNGQEEDPLDRQLQTEAIARLSSATWPEPIAFLGYVVTKVGALKPAPYQILMESGKLWDVEISDYDRWCEYIAFRKIWRIGYARISHGDVTDTELQMAKFLVDNRTLPVDYKTNEELYHHMYEEALPPGWAFSRTYRGNGTGVHKYHVFDGPIYYLPPERFWDRYNRSHWDYIHKDFKVPES